VRALKLDEAKEIYRSRYWNVTRCEDLPAGSTSWYSTWGERRPRPFDSHPAGNPGSGTGRLGRARDAERAQNLPRGQDHPRFHGQAASTSIRSLDDFKVFGAGWTNRTNSMLEAALRMATPKT